MSDEKSVSSSDNIANFVKVLNDIEDTDVRANDTTKESEEKDETVLDESPTEPSQVSVPVRRRINQRRVHDGQGRHLDGAQEGDDEVEPWNGSGKRD